MTKTILFEFRILVIEIYLGFGACHLVLRCHFVHNFTHNELYHFLDNFRDVLNL
jgi:hypothetical protein